MPILESLWCTGAWIWDFRIRQRFCKAETALRPWCATPPEIRRKEALSEILETTSSAFHSLFNSFENLAKPPQSWPHAATDRFFILLHHLDYFSAVIANWERAGRSWTGEKLATSAYQLWKRTREAQELIARHPPKTGKLALFKALPLEQQEHFRRALIAPDIPRRNFSKLSEATMQLFYQGRLPTNHPILRSAPKGSALSKSF